MVFARNGAIYASSRDVAERFEKRHADVLRTIEELDCSSEFRKRNFAFSVYRAEGQARTYPYVEMTRDGFAFLVMGFTGERAAYWKERYIDAFNLMEEEIRKAALPAPQIPDFSDPVVLVQLLTEHASKRIEAEKREAEAVAKIGEMAPTVAAYDRIATADGSLCVTDTATPLLAGRRFAERERFGLAFQVIPRKLRSAEVTLCDA